MKHFLFFPLSAGPSNRTIRGRPYEPEMRSRLYEPRPIVPLNRGCMAHAPPFHTPNFSTLRHSPLTIPVITGPTAVGKTDLSLMLADRLDADILSFDSRQIYRGMDIGTAKPTVTERRAIPHHFIDDREIDEPISAGAFADAAWTRITSIRNRERNVVAVGGSTLYLKALTQGLADIPTVPAYVRQKLNRRLQDEGPHRLYDELKAVDPAAAATMDPTKSQRIVRALEVYHATGRPLSEHQQNKIEPPFDFQVFVLDRDRAELYNRIEQRVDQMIDNGLIDEVRQILEAGFGAELPALRTIGYQEPIAFLRGAIDEAEMLRLLKRNTRRYAKRQLTWFRREPNYIWLDARLPAGELVDVIIARTDQAPGRST